MIQNNISPLGVITIMLICGAGWVFMSGYDVQQSLENEVSVHLEQARRILQQHSAELDYQSLLVDQIQNLDVELADPDDLSDDALDEYQEIHTQLWESFQPIDWGANPRDARANYGNLSRQMTDGRMHREDFINNNQKLLKQALSFVDDALAIDSGDQSGRNHAEANRLKGIVQYHLGLSHRISASLKRVEAFFYRNELVEAVNRMNRAQPGQSLVADSNIDEQIIGLNEQIQQTQADLDQDQHKLDDVQQQIRGLNRRISKAKSLRDDARKQMDRLKSSGLDFSDPNGAQTFAIQLQQQDRIFRKADREAQSLDAGLYPHAQIDASGDFLRGRYVENGSVHNLTIEHGLHHYENEQKIISATIDGLQRMLENLYDDKSRLESLKDSYAIAQVDAAKQIRTARKMAADAWDALIDNDADAFDLEETALAFLDKSAKSSELAARYSGDWVNDARDKIQKIAQPVQDLSAFQQRTNDGWMGGHISAQSADARIVMAWIHYERFIASTLNAQILSALPDTIRLKDANADDELASATDARDAGAELVQQVSDTLKKAHRDAERHWTMVAQQADATYLLALFGDDSYVDDAIEGYRNAIKGREDKAYVRRIADRLHRLENRK